jgi:hypothetical protein
MYVKILVLNFMVKKNLRCCNKQRTSYSEGSNSISEQQYQEPLPCILSTKTDSKYTTPYACVHAVFLLTQTLSGLCKKCSYVRTLTLNEEMKKWRNPVSRHQIFIRWTLHRTPRLREFQDLKWPNLPKHGRGHKWSLGTLVHTVYEHPLLQ